MSYYTDHGTACDWQACGVATIGGAEGLGGGVFFFEFRSKSANCRGSFMFLAAGLGLGGDMGGGSGPSPGDVIHNRQPDLWTSLECINYFSADDLDMSVGQLFLGTVTGAYGYSVVRISAGLLPVLFRLQSCSGWSTGVGVGAAVFTGVWKQLGTSSVYY